MRHFKTKLKITSPSWKCLFIAHFKLFYSKTNVSSFKTWGETFGNFPSSDFSLSLFPIRKFSLVDLVFSIPLSGGLSIKYDSNSNETNNAIVTQLCCMATPAARISARSMAAELSGLFPSVVCTCRWCGLTWELRNWELILGPSCTSAQHRCADFIGQLTGHFPYWGSFIRLALLLIYSAASASELLMLLHCLSLCGFIFILSLAQNDSSGCEHI